MYACIIFPLVKTQDYLQAQWLQNQVPNNFKTSQKCHKLFNVKKYLQKILKLAKKIVIFTFGQKNNSVIYFYAITKSKESQATQFRSVPAGVAMVVCQRSLEALAFQLHTTKCCNVGCRYNGHLPTVDDTKTQRPEGKITASNLHTYE